jgi:hypothetical protein
MTPASYIAYLVRPDLALLREDRRRGWRFLSARKDRALRNLLAGAPFPAAQAESFAEASLSWAFRALLPVNRGQSHHPQPPAQTLHTLSGDCDDGALLLATILVSALHPDAWPRFRFCVGSINFGAPHAFLAMDSETQGCVLLDWTLSPRPRVSVGEAVWRVHSQVPL